MYDARPERPRPPDPGESPKARGSLIPLSIVALFALVLFASIVVFTGRAGLLMMGVICAVLALPLFHYLAWGWWLTGVIREDEEESKRNKTNGN